MERIKKEPLVSVVIPVYNVKMYLQRCLKSVINQSYRNLEIIIIDDGSNDGSEVICDKYVAKDSRIKVIHKENSGAGPARNAGLDIATGEYIGFVDADDYIDEDMYEYLVETIESSGADIAQCGIIEAYAEKEVMPRYPDYYEITDNVTGMRRLLEARVTSMYIYNKLYRASLFRSIRFHNFKIGEDRLLLAEIMHEVKNICFTNVPKYNYYHRAESLTTKEIKKDVFDEIENIDLIFDSSVSLSASLEEPARMRKCWVRFAILDKIYATGKSFDIEKERDLIRYLRNEKKLILLRNYFNRSRKIAYIFMLIDWHLYAWIVRWFYKRNRIINS